MFETTTNPIMDVVMDWEFWCCGLKDVPLTPRSISLDVNVCTYHLHYPTLHLGFTPKIFYYPFPFNTFSIGITQDF